MLWQKMYKITNIWHFYAKKKAEHMAPLKKDHLFLLIKPLKEIIIGAVIDFF